MNNVPKSAPCHIFQQLWLHSKWPFVAKREGIVRSRNWLRMPSTLLFILALHVSYSSGQARDPNWTDKLSKIAYPEVKFRMYQVPMADAVKLSAAVWTTNIDHGNFPVVLLVPPLDILD